MTLPSYRTAARVLAAVALAAALFAFATSAAALAVGKDGYFQTGAGTRKKMGSNTYNIVHSIKELPGTKTKQALIDADVDKRFTMVFLPVPTLLRPIVGSAWPKDKITGSLKEAFALNGYADAGKIAKFLAAVTQDLNDKDTILIQYNAASKVTSITVKNGGKASIEGEDFMKAVWSLWFGKIEQKDLGEALAAKWLKEP